MKAFEFLDKVGKIDTNTMVLDKAIGYNTLDDMLTMTGEYFNLVKYGWGTSILIDEDIIRNKNDLYHTYDIKTYPGGTLFELAYKYGQIDEYFDTLDKLNFNAVEISNGSTDIPEDDRCDIIKRAKQLGFFTLSEVGKKNPQLDQEYTEEKRVELINKDIESGSDLVIIEGRESGKNIGIYDNSGNIKEDTFKTIINNTKKDKILWEAPNKNQQIDLILTLGNDVNLGNINSNDIISLETLRRGLRGDTLGKV